MDDLEKQYPVGMKVRVAKSDWKSVKDGMKGAVYPISHQYKNSFINVRFDGVDGSYWFTPAEFSTHLEIIPESRTFGIGTALLLFGAAGVASLGCKSKSKSVAVKPQKQTQRS